MGIIMNNQIINDQLMKLAIQLLGTSPEAQQIIIGFENGSRMSDTLQNLVKKLESKPK